MNALWTSQDAIAATGGACTVDWVAEGVSIDTRTIAKGDLFVALKDQRDGHEFVAQALAAGASAALVDHIPDNVAPEAPLLIVPNVLTALEALGTAGRARTSAKVVAVTGSVGKTSTKEMLRVMLSTQGKCHAAEKSYNNHWGVPLTLARMPADADFAVIEIGMNHPGEIGPLAKLTQPDVGLITTVAAVHLAAFDNIQGIAVEKSALFSGLTKNGVAIVNGDLETSDVLIDAAQGKTILRFGSDAGFEFVLENVTVTEDQTMCQAQTNDSAFLYKISSPGRHFALNALGALASVSALGADMGLAAVDLAQWVPFTGRGQKKIIQLDRGDASLTLTLIDDAYNANPTSVAAAIEILSVSNPIDNIGRIRKGRRIAVLGDMLELGTEEHQLHAGLAELKEIAKIDLVHCVGPLMKSLWSALPNSKRGHWFETSTELAELMKSQLDAGDVVLVKGSLGAKMAVIVDAIQNLGQSDRS
ncbi:MAG: UDP-N-acetylmuramoyl-tripeptide--D-alanyl-D-alanine ligase [Paracoccaceae bacterium]|nr:UDP-N-acetylmuramoyl-tripeptide--D-alanyl-D-alanine ligase [Paracoccaceae bacterium]